MSEFSSGIVAPARVLVVGGAGYVGSVLVPALLDEGYLVTVFDSFWFGRHALPSGHRNLTLVEGDIRDTSRFSSAVEGHDAVIMLACISNDASFELDPALARSINLDAFPSIVDASKKAGVSRFIFASSSSVYGVSASPDVTEEHPLVPLTDYNRFKGLAEPFLLEKVDQDFVGVVVRPATVCGPSPRLRLDLSVNILTYQAFHSGHITVFGGNQMRPNLHIYDMSRAYLTLLQSDDELVNGEVFNCGGENLSIMGIANLVKEIVATHDDRAEQIQLEVLETRDERSYHVNSEKIARTLGFVPQFSVPDAIRDLCRAFEEWNYPEPPTHSVFRNVEHMKALKVK